MADVVVRFSIYSQAAADASLLEASLKTPNKITRKGEPVLLTDGTDSGKVYQDTAFAYRCETRDVTDIEVCTQSWLNEWEKEAAVLAKLSTESGFKLHLNYEISVYGYNYPALYFQPDFLSFLGSTGIEFSLYFYNND